ncbi:MULTISPECIES: phytoene desaturase family protein [unclassified Rhizobium]|uniref:phytoene desaturase family protein n=2 Tax=unclassified Rhizobium TaxID=2613769 RepID=UPI001ADA7F1D|nr:NAD(P)/FAD-dependent oxidoreductase [Rhizobium sp. L58/93]MBO9131890.1 NAD(P)/FAD-dependent oxidoreductase [Rhizobium sp. B209b/85]MBO9169566.1 NAD(P)/FAD-dependent oxidoreductase [Rhizobium sp. L245/93]MBO9185517.1 NAD(P)/FAD-dependent oxidoreductase [Rhizobium sp. E27B/91]QXZ85830.1 NAD(P)/FAD-dependent oxidoreductase [Rhizobium sp. K1/93]QXZ91744.1 NAD(P)/FAD-dependent oxidoreductase [Rhizobium sp. K15/93]QXZ97906.1 NAD(P)/FAD-dependent oxidoreductase [Rhizobium sp. B230/85]QYA03337.1 
MMAYDAVVVGAGHNGLAAAVHLAAKGWKVAVVEGSTTAGGAVKTAEVTLPGFRHDLCAMNLSMFAGSAFLAQYRQELVANGLGFVPAADCFASVFRDGTYLGVSTDLEKTAAAIAALSPEDAEAWRAMLAEFTTDARHIFGLLGAPMPSLAAANVLWKAWRQKGSGWLYDTVRMLLSSPRGFLDARFRHAKLKTMMAAWGLHLDFAPDVAGGALFPYLESMANQAFGMVIGQGGADTIIKAMTGMLTARGGEILLGTAVDKVLVSGGKATGVLLADGRRLEASRAVIANVNPKNLFGKLLDADPKRRDFDRKVSRFRAGPGTMMIHLALDSLPDWTAGEALKSFAYVHIAPDLEMMSKVYAEAAAGLLPIEPALVVGQPTAIDPSRAPAGKHVLWVQVRVLPAEILGDAAGQIGARSWDAAKEDYADRVIDIIEAHAPGLRAKILARTVVSPLDLERENPNLIGGDSLSGSHHLDQNFLFRPVAGYSRYRTPVAGLYMCGASTWPGAGTGAGSGFLLARMLAK